MKKNSSTVVLFAFVGLLALSGCGGDEAVKPDTAPTETNKGADTSGAGTQTPQGTVDDSKAGPGGGTAGDTTGGDGAASAERRVHFGFDSDSIDGENRAIVEANAAYMKANPNMRATLEGHSDERGTRDYNLGLGERRAKAVARMLGVLGIPASRVKVTSYGEEKPLASGSGENAWAQNRRVEIIYQ